MLNINLWSSPLVLILNFVLLPYFQLLGRADKLAEFRQSMMPAQPEKTLTPYEEQVHNYAKYITSLMLKIPEDKWMNFTGDTNNVIQSYLRPPPQPAIPPSTYMDPFPAATYPYQQACPGYGMNNPQQSWSRTIQSTSPSGYQQQPGTPASTYQQPPPGPLGGTFPQPGPAASTLQPTGAGALVAPPTPSNMLPSPTAFQTSPSNNNTYMGPPTPSAPSTPNYQINTPVLRVSPQPDPVVTTANVTAAAPTTSSVATHSSSEVVQTFPTYMGTDM